jgi:hypothetical protein
VIPATAATVPVLINFPHPLHAGGQKGNLMQVLARTSEPFPSLLKEHPAQGAMLGPLAIEIITDQMYRSFFGEGGHFWMNDRSAVRGFQMEVMGASLAKVIRANTLAHVPDHVMHIRA